MRAQVRAPRHQDAVDVIRFEDRAHRHRGDADLRCARDRQRGSGTSGRTPAWPRASSAPMTRRSGRHPSHGRGAPARSHPPACCRRVPSRARKCAPTSAGPRARRRASRETLPVDSARAAPAGRRTRRRAGWSAATGMRTTGNRARSAVPASRSAPSTAPRAACTNSSCTRFMSSRVMAAAPALSGP